MNIILHAAIGCQKLHLLTRNRTMKRDDEAEKRVSELGCNTPEEQARHKHETMDQVFTDQGVTDPPKPKEEKKSK